MTTQDASESAAERQGRGGIVSLLQHRAVDPIMLFFDLVYVYLITEIDEVVIAEPGWRGVAQAAVLLVLVYWQWTLVTIQSSLRDASTDRHRLTIMLLMLIVMVSAVAVPHAFGERALMFAVTCWGSRMVITFCLARHEDSNAFHMDLVSSLIQGPLMLGGAILGGNGQLALWTLAALWEVTGPLRHSRAMSAQRYDVGNVVERFSLLIIVALGETIISIDTPQASIDELSWVGLVGLATAFILVGGLWWTYFHHSLELMEHYISSARTPFLAVRSLLVYGHFALVAGLIGLSVGLHHIMAEPLQRASVESMTLLCGGAFVFLAMFAVIRLRSARKIYRSRVLACILCLALIPAGPYMRGVLLVSLLALITVAECLWETLAPTSAGVPDLDELADRASLS